MGDWISAGKYHCVAPVLILSNFPDVDINTFEVINPENTLDDQSQMHPTEHDGFSMSRSGGESPQCSPYKAYSMMNLSGNHDGSSKYQVITIDLSWTCFWKIDLTTWVSLKTELSVPFSCNTGVRQGRPLFLVWRERQRCELYVVVGSVKGISVASHPIWKGAEISRFSDLIEVTLSTKNIIACDCGHPLWFIFQLGLPCLLPSHRVIWPRL